MNNDAEQYKASNYLKNKNDASQYHSSNFVKKYEQNKPGLLERAATDVQQYINEPIEQLGRGARDLIGGFGQGLANIGPGLYNLGASGINALGGSISKTPMVDIVPHSPSQQAGEIASFFAPGGLFKALGKVPAFAHTAKSAMKIPMIAEGIKHASNILNKSPLATRIAGNSLLGGAYSPDNQLEGMVLGGSAPLIGKAASSTFNALKPFATNPKNLFKNKESIKNFVLNKHDELEDRASKSFSKVSDEVNKRGVNNIPIQQKGNISEGQLTQEFFDQIKNYLPNTRASSQFINQAKTGDYNAIRKLQTDLYTRAKQNLGSKLEADRLKGEEMLEKRNDINQAISNHLRNTGNVDLDKVLNEARNDWSTLQKIYYNENMSNALVKMFDKKIRKIPKNFVNIFSEESIPMKNLLDFHPGLEEKLSGYQQGQKILKKGIKYGIPSATAFGGYEYGRHK